MPIVQIGSPQWIEIIRRLNANDSTLTILDLSGSKIGNEGASELSHSLLKNHTLIVLNLSSNEIGDEGAENLSLALRINRSLNELILDDNPFDATIRRALRGYIGRNANLSAKLKFGIEKADLDMVESAIALGANLLVPIGNEQNIPLHYAILQRSIYTSPYFTDNETNIPFYIMERMWEMGLSIMIRNGRGATALDLAIDEKVLLQQELEIYKKQLEIVNTEKAKLQKSELSLTSQNEKLKNELAEKEIEIQALKASSQELEKGKEEEIAKLTLEMQSLMRDNQQLHQKFQERDIEITTLQQTTSQEVEIIEAKFNKVSKERDELNESSRKNEEELKIVQNKLSKIEENMARLTGESAQEKLELATLRAQKDELDRTKKELQSQQIDIIRQEERLRYKRTTIKDRLLKLKRKEAKLKSEDQRLKALNEELAKAKNRFEKARLATQRVSKLEKDFENLKKQLVAAKQEELDLRQSINAYKELLEKQHEIITSQVMKGGLSEKKPDQNDSTAPVDEKLVIELMAYEVSVGLIHTAIEDGLESAQEIQNGTQRHRFLAEIKKFQTEFENLETKIETAKPKQMLLDPIKQMAQNHAQKLINLIDKTRKLGLNDEDQVRILLILETIHESYLNGFSLKLSSKADLAPNDSILNTLKNSIIRACFNRALSEVNITIKNLKISIFISYARGALEDLKKVQQIANDLKSCDIRVSCDLWSKVGVQTLTGFVEEIITKNETRVDFVLVIGSPELYKAYHSKDGNVSRIEFEHIAIRYENEKKDVVPVLVSGRSKEESFPDYLAGCTGFVDICEQDRYYEGLWSILYKLIENDNLRHKISQIKFEFDKKCQFIKENCPIEKLQELYARELQMQQKQDEIVLSKIEDDHAEHLKIKHPDIFSAAPNRSVATDPNNNSPGSSQTYILKTMSQSDENKMQSSVKVPTKLNLVEIEKSLSRAPTPAPRQSVTFSKTSVTQAVRQIQEKNFIPPTGTSSQQDKSVFFSPISKSRQTPEKGDSPLQKPDSSPGGP